jgi:putative endonuclease
MLYTYVIRSISRNYMYVGITNNSDRRINEHNRGYNATTKPYAPFVLIFSREFNSRPEARAYERYLKSGLGREFLKTLG